MPTQNTISAKLQANQETINDRRRQLELQVPKETDANPTEAARYESWLRRSIKRLEREQKVLNGKLGVTLDHDLEAVDSKEHSYKPDNEKFPR